MTATLDRLAEAVHFLDKSFGAAPELALVLGSGLSAFAQELQKSENCSIDQIPGAHKSSVQGHRGELILGFVEGKRVAVQSGRIHGFEGYTPEQVVFVVRTLKMWGVKKFILTNASGTTHEGVAPGSLALIADQINFTGQNPLVGKELFGGQRFPDVSDLFSAAWRERAKKTAAHLGLSLKDLVYIGVLGPSYETAAEIRAFHRMGADIVGMSTVWEALALKQLGAELLGISAVCNWGTGVKTGALSHEEVLAAGLQIESDFRRLLRSLIRETLDG